MSSVSLEKLRVCPDCGLLSVLPPPLYGRIMCCSRCTKSFRRAHQHSSSWVLASAISAAIFYLVLFSAPFLEAIIFGRVRGSTMWTGIQTLGESGLWGLAGVVLVTAVIMPLLRIGGALIVFGALHMDHPPKWIIPIFRYLKYTSGWAMVEIYLLGFLVAYTRLQALVHVHVETAVFALIGLVLSMISVSSTLDHETVWEEMKRKGLIHPLDHAPQHGIIGCDNCHQANDAGSHTCHRCGHKLHHRKENSMARTAALAFAAVIFYVPANAFPFMMVTNFHHPHAYTILGGVREFINAGMWPLALLVFTASVAVPLIKLLSLGMMMLCTRRTSPAPLKWMTYLYRFVEFIGRWSMIDVFMLSILVGLIHFGEFSRITPAPGALYFAAVVVLTIFAVDSFDPRLMWDAANKNKARHDR